MPIFLMFLTALMLLVIYFDAKQYIIPNWLNGTLLILYVPFVLLNPIIIDWQHALMGMAIVFVVGYAVFALKLMGGGDIKLFTVLSLWVGWDELLPFLFIVVILGGLLSIILVIARVILAKVAIAKLDTLPRVFKAKQPVPYGLAIAGGFFILLFTGKIAGIIV